MKERGHVHFLLHALFYIFTSNGLSPSFSKSRSPRQGNMSSNNSISSSFSAWHNYISVEIIIFIKYNCLKEAKIYNRMM